MEKCNVFCDYVTIYARKEIENFLLVPTAIDWASKRKVADQVKRTGREIIYAGDAAKLLDEFAHQKKAYVTAQYLDNCRRFERSIGLTRSDATITEEVLLEFESRWKDANSRLAVIPGKDAISALNLHLQKIYDISITPIGIIDAMTTAEVAPEMKKIIGDISQFASSQTK
jgi:hypothetical protein